MSRESAQWDFNPNTTLIRLLALNAQARPQQVALREKDLGIWQETTWSQWLSQTLQAAAGLAELGFTRGSGLLVVGDNRQNLYTGMLAGAALGGASREKGALFDGAEYPAAFPARNVAE